MKFYKRKKVTETKEVLDEIRCNYCLEKIKDDRVELTMRAGYGSQFDTIENDVLFDFCDNCFVGVLGEMYRRKQKLDKEVPLNYKEAKKILERKE